MGCRAVTGEAAASLRLLASEYNLEFVDLDHYRVDLAMGSVVPEDFARTHTVVPIGRKFGAPVIALADPADVFAADSLRSMVGREFVTVVADGEQIKSLHDRVYAGAANGTEEAPPSHEAGSGSDPSWSDPLASALDNALGSSLYTAAFPDPSLSGAEEDGALAPAASGEQAGSAVAAVAGSDGHLSLVDAPEEVTGTGEGDGRSALPVDDPVAAGAPDSTGLGDPSGAEVEGDSGSPDGGTPDGAASPGADAHQARSGESGAQHSLTVLEGGLEPAEEEGGTHEGGRQGLRRRKTRTARREEPSGGEAGAEEDAAGTGIEASGGAPGAAATMYEPTLADQGAAGSGAGVTADGDVSAVEVVPADGGLSIDMGNLVGSTLDKELDAMTSAIAPEGESSIIESFPALARILVEGKRVPLEDMLSVLAEHEATGQTVARVLTQRGLVTDTDLVWGIAQEMGYDFIDLETYMIDLELAVKIPEAMARRRSVLLIGQEDGQFVVAVSDPTDVYAQDDLRSVLGRNFKMVLSSKSQLNTWIDRSYTHGGSADVAAQRAAVDVVGGEEREKTEIEIATVSEDAPVVRYVNLLIVQALNDRASDIHIEPTHDSLRIRYRIDGVLHDKQAAPLELLSSVVTRIKVMGDLNIAEHRIPQDGRLSVSVGGRTIDLRLATIPTVYGEKLVMRILDKSAVVLELDKLGCEPEFVKAYRQVFRRPYGTIFVTGPTGSGKTTTLYATIGELNTPDKNIITVEDPVELRIKGINQVQTNNKAGLTFASALRSMLRADPDIVMVGEIRDRETALIAVEAALTGHLVLATMHTNDSSRTPMRLVEMGIEPYLVASSISAVVAQRLVRVLCAHCKEPYDATEKELVAAGFRPEEMEMLSASKSPTICKPVGCRVCSNTGFRGREGLYELLVSDDEMERLITGGASAEQIHQKAVAMGMTSLRHAGLEKVLAGETTLEEVLRVVA